MVDLESLEYLDDLARKAHAGDYRGVGVLSTGERLYVALASGRMRELCPGDSIPYAVDRVGPEWMDHMLSVWRSDAQPEASKTTADFRGHIEWKLQCALGRKLELVRWCKLWPDRACEVSTEQAELEKSIPELQATLQYLADFERE